MNKIKLNLAKLKLTGKLGTKEVLGNYTYGIGGKCKSSEVNIEGSYVLYDTKNGIIESNEVFRHYKLECGHKNLVIESNDILETIQIEKAVSVVLSNASFSSLNVIIMSNNIYIVSLDMSNSNFNNLKQGLAYVFFMRRVLETVNMSNSKFNSLTVLDSWFEGCSKLKSIDLSDSELKSIESLNRTFSYCSELKEISFKGVVMPLLNSIKWLFRNCSNLKSINLDFLKKSEKLENLSGLFQGCTSLKEVDLSNMKSDCISKISNIVSDCYKLEYFSMYGCNLENVVMSNDMFFDCSNLVALDLGDFGIPDLDCKDLFFCGMIPKTLKLVLTSNEVILLYLKREKLIYKIENLLFNNVIVGKRLHYINGEIKDYAGKELDKYRVEGDVELRLVGDKLVSEFEINHQVRITEVIGDLL